MISLVLLEERLWVLLLRLLKCGWRQFRHLVDLEVGRVIMFVQLCQIRKLSFMTKFTLIGPR